jgi:hypothetical protein
MVAKMAAESKSVKMLSNQLRGNEEFQLKLEVEDLKVQLLEERKAKQAIQEHTRELERENREMKARLRELEEVNGSKVASEPRAEENDKAPHVSNNMNITRAASKSKED